MVIPACNRPEKLRACLESLAPGRQAFSADRYEVIVTDDSPQPLQTSSEPWVRWTQGPRRGPAANRNHGARLATGDWIAFIDDDCLATPDWLAELARVIAPGNCELIEGKTSATGSVRHPLDEVIENPRGGNFWSCNLAVEQRAFQRLGGFDEDFTEPAHEDMEFAARALRAGLRPRFVPGAVVEHPSRRLGWMDLWRRALRVRWFSLYLLKTRPGWRDKTLLAVLPAVVMERTANLLRRNWKLLKNATETGLSRSLFLLLWDSATFPLLLPRILFWECRFRARARAGQPLMHLESRRLPKTT